MIAEMILVSMMGFTAQGDEGKPLELPTPPAPITSSKSKVKFNSTCTTDSGHSVNSEEPGYDSCVLKSTQKNTSTSATKSARDPNPANGNLEVKFGN
jgi:hypothetical protein